jgi:hypothetical protein
MASRSHVVVAHLSQEFLGAIKENIRMNVSNNLFGSIGTSLLSNVGSTSATTGTSTPSSVPPPMNGAGSASISGPGQFFSEMQQLSQSNPSEFKTVAAQVATSFQNAASQATGSQAQVLTNLANQFNQAAQTGSMPSPQGVQAGSQSAQGGQGGGGVGAHHHHRYHAGGSMSQSSGVQQAFQNAMSILEQAVSGSSSSGSSTPT